VNEKRNHHKKYIVLEGTISIYDLQFILDIIDHQTMSTSLNEPRAEQPSSSNKEIEIRELFSRHCKTLKCQMIMTIINIETWRHEHVKAIDRYVDEQKSILQADYDRQQREFNEKYEETLDIASAYHTAQQLDLFNQLRNECRLLEFQVAQLENVQAEMKFPKVITVEEQNERKKQEKLRMCQPENDEEEILITKDINITEDSGHWNGDLDSSSTSTLSTIIVTK
jgi:hypothetical protein